MPHPLTHSSTSISSSLWGFSGCLYQISWVWAGLVSGGWNEEGTEEGMVKREGIPSIRTKLLPVTKCKALDVMFPEQDQCSGGWVACPRFLVTPGHLKLPAQFTEHDSCGGASQGASASSSSAVNPGKAMCTFSRHFPSLSATCASHVYLSLIVENLEQR